MTTDAFTFSIRGTPRPKARARHVGGRVVTTTRETEKLWRAWVRRALKDALALRGDPLPLYRGPVRVDMIFQFEPPASARARIGTPHTHKPDKDNLEKLVLDEMKKAAVFADDSQVAGGDIQKVWGERAGVVVVAEPMTAAPAPPLSAAEPAAPSWLASSSS